MIKGKNNSEDDIVLEDENSFSDLELKKLREKLKKCVKEKEEYLTGWQRAKADFINARKEDEKSRGEFKKFAEMSLVMDILPIADSFETAFSDPNWNTLDRTWQTGIKSLYGQLLNVLKEHSLSLIETEGKKFNPQEHESVREVELDDKEKDGMVIREARKGYKMKDRILRPAQVEVGKYKSNE